VIGLVSDLINVVGAGRVGKSLAKALKLKNWEIGIIANRSFENSKKAVKFIGGGRPTTTKSKESPEGILLICVPDDVLENLKEILKNWDLRNLTSIIHTSGALSSDVLDFAPENVGRASLHPVKAFANPLESFKSLRGVYFGIEGDEIGARDALKIVESLEGIPFNIKTTSKLLYHLSAAIASNFTVGLFWLAELLQNECGIPNNVSKKILLKLMEGTLENLSKLETQKALTGPVIRGDWKLIEREKEELQRVFPEFVDLFNENIKLLKRVSENL